MLDIVFRPDRSRPEPIVDQLGEHLRGLVETGRLATGTKLPATRELALALSLSRATVTQAYESLIAEGWLAAHVGQGTFVARRATAPAGASPARSFVWPGLFAQRTRLLAAPRGLAAPTDRVRFDFRGGQVDAESLPLSSLRIALSRTLRRERRALASHGDPFGWLPLRRAVAYLLVGRGLSCGADEILIVDGSQQAVDLAARVLIDPGDTVVVEQPGYFGATLAFTACQANLVGVGVDDQGLRTDELARVFQARRVKLAYVTPATQCPTGAMMSESRRRELLALADEHQVPILEDDYDAELRYEGPPVAALKAADSAGQVIYAGTFSKMLFPTLRLGFVVAAPPLLRKMSLARFAADAGGNVLLQAALARLLESGALVRHVRRMRRIYAERLRTMRTAIARHMPEGSRSSQPRGGQMVWLELPRSVDADGLHQAALAAGILYTRGDAFFIDGRGADCLSLCFSVMPPRQIEEGVAELAALLRRHRTSQQRPGRTSGRRPNSRRGGTRVAS